MDCIVLDSLTKYYGKTCGINNVSLRVDKGDFFGFVGPNGAGKSTTIRTILGLLRPTSGKGSVLGYDIVTESEKILSKCGYLSSDAIYYNGMTVSDIIRLSASLRGLDCSEEAKKLCDIFELDTTKKVRTLSLGNKKKVGIVCAMQHRPELYILDEPTSGLDPLMQKTFFDILEERNREGATVFLSSHILPEVQKHCRNAAVIRDGHVVTCDSVENLSYTGVKRVVLKQAHITSPLPYMNGFKEENGGVSFVYNGSAQSLIEELSKLTFDDVTIGESDFEEAFMHFYAKEDKKDADI